MTEVKEVEFVITVKVKIRKSELENKISEHKAKLLACLRLCGYSPEASTIHVLTERNGTTYRNLRYPK